MTQLLRARRNTACAGTLSGVPALVARLRRSDPSPAAFVIALLVAWEVGAHTVLNVEWTSSPSIVAVELWRWISSGAAVPHLLSTVEGTVLGFGIGGAAGLVLGIALASSRTLWAISEPYIIALYSLPSLALAPLFVVVFGISLWSKVAFAALTVFLLTTFMTYRGVRDVPIDLLVAIRLMGPDRGQVLFKVVLPAAVTSILLGLRTSAPMALRATVFGELVASTEGIGYVIKRGASLYDTGLVFAALLTLGIVGFAVDMVLSYVESRLSPVALDRS